jgi:hypothetical protein
MKNEDHSPAPAAQFCSLFPRKGAENAKSAKKKKGLLNVGLSFYYQESFSPPSSLGVLCALCAFA